MLLLAIILMVLAYILYTLSIFTEKMKKKLNVWIVIVFGTAFTCDLSGTTIMELIAISSGKNEMNFHSACGYSALFIMTVHFILSIVALKKHGRAEALFSKCSIYAWII